jgi:hypothetical protein
MGDYFFACNPILFAVCTSTFSKLCKKKKYTMACRRVLTSTPDDEMACIFDILHTLDGETYF